MSRLRQRTGGTVQQCRPCHYDGLAPFLGVSFLLLLTGCAQLDQLMGKQAASAGPQPLAQSANSAPGVSAPEPAPKPAAKKKTDGSLPASVTKEPHPQAPAHQVAPTAGTVKQPEPELKQTDQDKVLAEKDQFRKEKKSHVATDKKSTKKSPKSQAESQPPTEDVFLSPVPLPSKPAAIGGSGG